MPEAHLELLDIDPKILDQARERFSAENHCIKFKLGSFFEELPQCDAVLASLSLHHISAMIEKTKVYTNIYSALKPGGLFLCMDVSVCADDRVSAESFDQWANHMGKHGIKEETARRHFAEWKKEEHYHPIHDELIALTKAGFANPECFWRKGPMAIYGALK